MKEEIIVKKSSWRDTLNEFSVGDRHVFDVNVKDMNSIKSAASRLKKNTGKIFITKILDNGIDVNRIK